MLNFGTWMDYMLFPLIPLLLLLYLSSFQAYASESFHFRVQSMFIDVMLISQRLWTYENLNLGIENLG
jgi:hypothetical protein